MTSLFDPITVGKLDLPNRLVMAPMTRSRAAEGGLATELMATYYAQRAGAGLIIAEGTQPSAVGQGYLDTPGLHTPEQVAAWRRVTDAVHAAGGRIFVQLMHTGRIGHPSFHGQTPVAPSPVRAPGRNHTQDGPVDMVDPRPLTEVEIDGTIADHVAAARNAIEAGFDGVELHGANGYLIHQFLSDNTNLRTDGYGGSAGARIRFAVETARAVAEAIGPERVGMRISPGNGNNGMVESEQFEVYEALARALNPVGLAYLHVMEFGPRAVTHAVRAAWAGALILNGHHEPGAANDPDLAAAAVADGLADAVSFGALFLANPDLPARLRAGGPYNEADRATFYGGDHRGLTDYPTLPAA